MKVMKSKYWSHIDSYVKARIEEEASGYKVSSVRLVRYGVVKVMFHNNDEATYFYKGYRILENDSVGKGYWGRWRIGAERTDTLEDCVSIANQRISKKLGKL